MRAVFALVIALASAMLWLGESDAAHEGLFLVAQPLSIESPPLLVVCVPYVGYSIDWSDPARK